MVPRPPCVASVARGLDGCPGRRRQRREPPHRGEMGAAGDWLHVDITPLGRFGQAGHRAHGDRRRTSRGAGGGIWAWCGRGPPPAGVCRGARRAARPHLCRVPPARGRVARGASGGRPSRLERPRGRRPRARVSRRVCRRRDPASPDAALHAPHERHGGTRDSDALARVGLRDALSHVTRSSARAATVAAFLQSPAAACEPERCRTVVAAQKRCLMNNVLELNT